MTEAPSLDDALAKIPALVDALQPSSQALRAQLLAGAARRAVWLSVYQPEQFAREFGDARP